MENESQMIYSSCCGDEESESGILTQNGSWTLTGSTIGYSSSSSCGTCPSSQTFVGSLNGSYTSEGSGSETGISGT